MDAAPRSPFPVKLGLLIVLLPLALAGAGVWQFARTAEHAALLAKVERSITALENIQREANDPDVTIKTPDGKTFVASTLLRRNVAFRNDFLRTTWWRRTVCPPMAAGVIALGVAGAVMGFYGLFTVRRAGRKALHSREALLQGFQDGLRKLPWIIGAIGLFIALATAFCGAFELVNFIESGVKGRGGGKIVTAGVLAVGALLFFGGKLVWNIYTASKAVFEREPLRLMGKSVTRAEAPLVWEFVARIAEKAGAAMPDAIILGLDEGFFVTEHPVELLSGGPVPQGRVLYLPLPYMAYMTRPEAEAVIGHELGHFTGADTEYSLRFSPIYAAAVNNLRAVDAVTDNDDGFMGLVARPAMMFGIYYLASFDLVVQHWSREREFAADGMGAHIAGNDAIALSLLRISVLAPHVYQALEECWAKGGRLEGGVLHRVRELVREHGLGDPAEHLEDTQSHPTDSHPATSKRLEAVNVPVTPELLARARCPEESTLLHSLGLEGNPAVTLSDSSTDPFDAARMRAGLSAALEAEFSRAAKSSADSMTENLREYAAQGTEPVAVYESVLRIRVLAAVGALGAGTIAFFAVWEGERGIAAGAAAAAAFFVWLFLRLGGRGKYPFMTMTADGFSAGNMEGEIPWAMVDDYGITANSTNGFQTSVELVIDLEQGYEPPAASGNKCLKYNAKHQRLSIRVQGVAKPYSLERFAEEFHLHWYGALARQRLRELEA